MKLLVSLQQGIVQPGENFFYSVNYRTYDKGSIVKTFTLDDLKRKLMYLMVHREN